MAFVGGASYCKSDSLVLFSAAHSVSARGSCPFSAEADGLISAEGYVIVLLKTLAKAEADGDRIYGVIRSLGISSDGRGRSLWAPLVKGQVQAVSRAYRTKDDGRLLQYIEAHATSTKVGDATELTALSQVLKQVLPAGSKIPIGSVKLNVGHTLETAGMAGLIKVLLSMQHGVIPPACHAGPLNTQIDWDDVPFFVSPTAPPLGGTPRRRSAEGCGQFVRHRWAQHSYPGGPIPRKRSSGVDSSAHRAGCGNLEC